MNAFWNRGWFSNKAVNFKDLISIKHKGSLV